MSPAALQPGLLRRLDSAPRKVVIVRASRLGDFICATPAFDALRHALPGADISLVGLPFVRELARRLSTLDRFIPFPGFPGIAEQYFEPRRTAAFFARMQHERFDLAIQLHGSGVHSNPFTLMLGARRTAGLIRPGDPPGRLDAAFPMEAGGHEVDALLAFTSFLGAPSRTTRPRLVLFPNDRVAASRALAGLPRPWVGIHPGAREATKRWPLAHFASLAADLRRRRGGSLILLGGPEEVAATREIESRLDFPCRRLAGQLSLPAMAALVARLSVLVTNDSGPAHIAYALGTRSVTLFGGTDPARWGPRGGNHLVLSHAVPCRPCQGDHCRFGFACLEAIRPEAVAAAAEGLLAAPPGGADGAPGGGAEARRRGRVSRPEIVPFSSTGSLA